ncbi:MAG: DUF58 domain-containing protein [Christensenellaceae bacterium]|nr:DUF58 domain-containing protein [Christensenellaceae bacterium]
MKKKIIGAVVGYVFFLLFLLILLMFCPSVWILSGVVFMIMIPGLSFLLNLYVRKHLRIFIKLPATTAKNSAVMGKVEFRNDSLLPIVRLFCVITMLNDLTGEQEELLIQASVGAKRKKEHMFLLQGAYCGRLYIPVKSVYIMDYFGMIPLRVQAKSAVRITILPEIFPAEIGERLFSAESEESSAERKGDDRTEIFQLREYQPGDDVRQIHWKLSSKLDELILKEPGMPQSRSRLVFWDKRVHGTPSEMNALADSVASVCNALLENGEQFRLSYTEREELREWEITDENILLQAIPALAKCAATQDCPDPSFDGYGNILYFSTEYSEKLSADERIVQIICTHKMIEQSKAVVFTPENYREQLQRLEI